MSEMSEMQISQPQTSIELQEGTEPPARTGDALGTVTSKKGPGKECEGQVSKRDLVCFRTVDKTGLRKENRA